MTLLERRAATGASALQRAGAAVLAVTAALVLGALLFAHFGANPLAAYYALLHEPFGTLRGFGYTLVAATPLTLIALGTIVAWRSGFIYLGFEGCFVLGAAATAWLALSTMPGHWAGWLPAWLFLPAALVLSSLTGALWAGWVGLLRARFLGNEVLLSLMSNYIAIFIVRYLVGGRFRAPGSIPETPQLPHATWLAFILPGTRAHSGIVLAVAVTFAVWLLLRRLPLGFEMLVTGLNPAAARYSGIHVSRTILTASYLAGALGALAGLGELLGAQHRLMDGISGGIGFTGIIVALLAELSPVAVLPVALLYGGMTVGADAMQRRAGIPSSITYILQSLIVLLILASAMFTRYRLRPANLRHRKNGAPLPGAGLL